MVRVVADAVRTVVSQADTDVAYRLGYFCLCWWSLRGETLCCAQRQSHGLSAARFK